MATTTRRRGPELERAIAEAVRAELVEHGYAGTTYEGVAARAGTGKPPLYRRWSTKAEMVLAALLTVVPAATEDVDTGTLAGDLKALLTSLRDLFNGLGRDILLHLMAELPEPATRELQQILLTRRTELLTPLVNRARQRGELGPAPLSPSALNLPFDLVRHEMLVVGGLSDDGLAAIVDETAVPFLTALSRHGITKTVR